MNFGEEVLLTVESVSKSYGGTPVFDDVSFHLKPASVTWLRGHNGSGKSTLLNCILGADEVDTGTISWKGRPRRETDAAFRGAVSAAVDSNSYFSDVSVIEHLRLIAVCNGVQDSDDAARHWCERCGLATVSDSLPGALSSGQRQRMALAMAMLRPFELLILDEPERHLDTEGCAWLANTIDEFVTAGCAVLAATHNSALVDSIAGAAIELDR
ncbi:ABC transporter ATP-binding protein [Rhodococcoides corynebacterioides]|uniref:ABC transporter ATP-binding protein n=1 Tax=Rhodococcoides corynebacterioides TaxID=53972 RepID=UPI003AE98AA5